MLCMTISCLVPALSKVHRSPGSLGAKVTDLTHLVSEQGVKSKLPSRAQEREGELSFRTSQSEVELRVEG